jgi:hypothetical protein
MGARAMVLAAAKLMKANDMLTVSGGRKGLND